VSDLKWSDVPSVDGTSLSGYFMEGCTYRQFKETVAKIITVSGQMGTDATDGYKCSVEFVGTFKGQVFTLYDYKEDFQLHIGGRDGLDVRDLIAALTDALKDVTPTPFVATLHYDSRRQYGWPNASGGLKAVRS